MKKFWKWKNSIDKEKSERTLFFNGVIAEESWYGDEITPKLFKDELNTGTGNIKVWINSPGGDCIAAAQIYNMLKDYKGRVTVFIDGLAASAASVMAMAGDEIIMSPVSLMMIHNPSCMAWGESKDLRKEAEILDEFKESIINAYEIKTGLSRVKISHLMDCETWMNAHKAVELGFADRINDNSSENSVDMAEAFSAVAITRHAAANALLGKIKQKEEQSSQKDFAREVLKHIINDNVTNEYSVCEIIERLNCIKKHI